LLSSLQHPNIVNYKESFLIEEGSSEESLCIVMGYCANGDLYSKLQRLKQAGKQLLEKVTCLQEIATLLKYFIANN
jgi:serine/threonine protein kinase